MKKTVLVSIDHPYGLGHCSVDIITEIRKDFESRNYAVYEHVTPDIPRALLQGSEPMAFSPMVGESFWFDFQTELFAKAKVCDQINSQMRKIPSGAKGVVVICKNMNGTAVHGMLRECRWHEDGMDQMERRARCGISFNEEINPDINILLDADPKNVYPVYKATLDDLLFHLRSNAKVYQKISNLFARMDYFKQRDCYLNEFERLGKTGYILNAEKSIAEITQEIIEIIQKKL